MAGRAQTRTGGRRIGSLGLSAKEGFPAVVKAALDRGGAAATRRLTSTWPGWLSPSDASAPSILTM
ncbi:hypothetical protein GCM10010507_20190 [Streptomyces cinnamoneus]|uniref:Uncharacterized protein n=1 Tax=Streptomyces cinnamoneus TaxID=53446 RepID=A0A918WF12_STRCJ|nr:hypothetical protein GCM10010507_20190 [Streptomyces cinnamoneus]